MTIAIGMLCDGGMIVAADTKATMTDGSTRQEHKVCMFDGKTIAFAIADASDDANAAKSMVNTLSSLLMASNTHKLTDIEAMIARVMTEWYKPFKEAPVTSLIVAIILKGFESQLYLCQPPNTVLPEPEGYIAAGIGRSVTDPLFTTLFHPNPRAHHPQTALRHIAYLMYRAKKDNAWCGGETDVAYLDTRAETASWVHGQDMKNAEKASSQLDTVLNIVTTVVVRGTGPISEHNANAVSDVIRHCEILRNTVFRDVRGNEIDYKINSK